MTREEYRELLNAYLNEIAVLDLKYILADNFDTDEWWKGFYAEYAAIGEKKEYAQVPNKSKLLKAFIDNLEAAARSLRENPLESRKEYKKLLMAFFKDVSAIETKYILADNFDTDEWWSAEVKEFLTLSHDERYKDVPNKDKMILAFATVLEVLAKTLKERKE